MTKIITKYSEFNNISENALWHITNGKSLVYNEFRYGSDEFYDLLKEARMLNETKQIEFNDNERIILESLKTGERAIYQGKSVVLDSPKYYGKGHRKKLYVYHDSGKKDKDGNIIAKKISWGDPNLKIKNYDKEKADAFQARHKCKDCKDMSTPKWWACNVHLFADMLNLSSDYPW